MDTRRLLTATHLTILALLLPVPGAVSGALGQDEGTRTNLSLFQDLAFRIGASLADTLAPSPGDSICVEFQPRENTWFLEEGLLRGLSSKALAPTRSQAAGYAASISVEKTSVHYSDVRSEGLFGSEVVDRRLSLALNVRVARRASGQYAVARTFEESRQDTVRLSEIEHLEQPLTPITHGDPPREGFFASLLEPVILIGAIAVAVVLLFSVRS